MPEKVWGDTFDFVNVSFLTRGALAARAVARIATTDGAAIGTGFLIGDGLFMTNAHVIGTIAEAQRHVLQFDYELGINGAPLQSTRFLIDPSVFITHPVTGLDFAIFAIGAKLDGPAELADYGLCGLSDAANKHMLGENVNIVQHPAGRLKEVVLRENKLVARLDDVLHYVADTEPGSSGSPVFNNEWEVVALHHWGGIARNWIDASGRPVSAEVNEGVRISVIARHLRLPGLPLVQRSRVERALQLGAERHAVRTQAQDLPSPQNSANAGWPFTPPAISTGQALSRSTARPSKSSRYVPIPPGLNVLTMPRRWRRQNAGLMIRGSGSRQEARWLRRGPCRSNQPLLRATSIQRTS